MGGTNRHYPVGVQAKMHVYSSSRRSAAQFKPPTLIQHGKLAHQTAQLYCFVAYSACLPAPSFTDDGVCLTNSELLAMYSTGSKEQPREEGEVPVHVGGEGEVINDKCTITGEVTQPQSGVRRTTISRCTASVNAHCTPCNLLDGSPLWLL